MRNSKINFVKSFLDVLVTTAFVSIWKTLADAKYGNSGKWSDYDTTWISASAGVYLFGILMQCVLENYYPDSLLSPRTSARRAFPTLFEQSDWPKVKKSLELLAGTGALFLVKTLLDHFYQNRESSLYARTFEIIGCLFIFCGIIRWGCFFRRTEDEEGQISPVVYDGDDSTPVVTWNQYARENLLSSDDDKISSTECGF